MQHEDTIPVTACMKLRHGVLHELAKKMGSQKAAADALGVHPVDFGQWCNLKRTPPKTWSPEKSLAFSQKIMELTGKSVDEIWPDWLDDALGFDTQGEQTRSLSARELKAIPSSSASPAIDIDRESLGRAVEDTLRTLTFRERQIVKLRYGLGNSSVPKTLQEIGDAFRISRERVREIEVKAMRKLRSPARTERLKEFDPHASTDAVHILCHEG